MKTVCIVYYEDGEIVSSKFVAFINRLFTAVMLVALLIACQDMPENNNLGDIQIEHLSN